MRSWYCTIEANYRYSRAASLRQLSFLFGRKLRIFSQSAQILPRIHCSLRIFIGHAAMWIRVCKWPIRCPLGSIV